VLAWGDIPAGFLPGIAGGDYQHPIEIYLVEGALGGVEMGDVDRVEGPAEDSGSHGREDRAVVVRLTAAPD
jgi:hypothetical protein